VDRVKSCGVWARLAVSLALAFCVTAPACPQDAASGAIAGTLYDASGALITHASITAVGEQTRLSRSVPVNGQGVFRLSLLPPGTYSVTVQAAGFEPSLKQGISVNVGEVTSLSFKLATGKLDVVVDVDITQPETSALGRVTDESTIQALPLANRNYTQILALSPGVAVELPNAANLGRNNQNVSASGSGTTTNNFQFNGIDANNLSLNSASGYQSEVGLAIPAPDVIQQFKAQTAGYDAAYGRGSGANVDVISKTGTNHLHGSLWEFFRNDVLNANDFFAKANGQPRPVLKQNQFGFTLGGPIRRDKTFLFGAYQGTTQRNGVSNLSLVTAILPQLTADRSAAALGKQFCPANHPPPNAGYKTFGGGTQVACDGSNINPVALALLNFKFSDGAYAIPSPQTLIPSTDSNQLPIGESTFSLPAKYREDQYTVNLDHAVSTKNELAGRFFYSRAPTVEPFSPFGANVPGWGTNELDQNHMFVLSDTHAFRANLTNVARFGFMRFDGFASIAQPITAAALGMATPGNLPEIPGLSIAGLFTIGTAGQPFYWQNTNTFVWQDTVSYTVGRHALRAGAEAKRHQVDVNVPFVSDGFVFLFGLPDLLVGQSATQNGSLVSNVYSATASSGLFAKYERYKDFAGFVQDDIRLAPRLTINAGVRYEIFGAPSDIHGRLPTFDPSIASATVPSAGSLSGFVLPANYTGPLPGGAIKSGTSGLWSTTYKDISPRFGFSLRLSERLGLLLRGGYGIYSNRMSGNLAETTVGQPPFSFKQSLQGAQNGAATLQQPYNPALPAGSSFPIFLPRVPGGGLSLAAISPRLKDPYLQKYNLNLQYELKRNLLLEVGYVGARGTHLAGCIEFNQALIASPQHPVGGEITNRVDNVVQRLPYQGIAPGSYICQTTFSSSYNSLQTSVTQRLSHGLEFLGSYTWSKELDSTSGSGGLSNFELGFLTNDQTNPRQARGLGDFDRANRGVLSLVYNVPQPPLRSAVLRHALYGWSVSTVAVAETGSPITVTDSGAGSIYGNLSGFSRAQCTGLNPRTQGSTFDRLHGYLNQASFSPPPRVGADPSSTAFGNCGVGILRGPTQRGMDLAVGRSFPIKEFGNLQFRTEFFNLTNTANFGNPNSNRNTGSSGLPGPGFGFITTTTTNPRIIQFALKYSY
jgi:hypothetical protein